MRIQLVSPLGIIEKGSQAIQGDSFYPHLDEVSASDNVFVLCDGLGGHAHSEVASAEVAKSIAEWMKENFDFKSQPTALTIKKAVAHAQQTLNQTYEQYEASKYPMGTTMAMLAIGRFGAVASHIGDTRIYHIRPERREILYRSRDHSLVNDLFVAGRLTRAEAEASPKRNVLTRAMLPAPSAVAMPDVAFITDIKAGDYFVICSDGISCALSDRKLKEVLCNKQYTNAQKVARIKMLTDGSRNNHSFLLIEVENVEKEDGDRLLVNTERLMCDKMVRRSVILAPAPARATAAPTDDETPSETAPESDMAAIAPPVPTQALEEDTTAPSEEPTNPKPSPKKENEFSMRKLWMLLAFLLLVVAILALVLNKCNKNSDNSRSGSASTESSKTVEPTDTDYIINNVVPDKPLEEFTPTATDGEDDLSAFPTGSNVAVTPAPRVTDLPTPKSHYDTGSNVDVPRVKEGDPYPDEFDNRNDYKELEQNVPENPVANNSEQQQQTKPGSVPPPKKKAPTDPYGSNRNVSVPPPRR